MIMALGTTHVDAEEDPGCVVCQIIEAADSFDQKTVRALRVVNIPRTEHDLAKNLVPGFVLADGSAQVVEELGSACVFFLNHVVEDAAEMQTVFRAENEPLDRLPAPVWPAVLGERDGFIATGDSAREVERDATQEGSIVNRQGRLDLPLGHVLF